MRTSCLVHVLIHNQIASYHILHSMEINLLSSLLTRSDVPKSLIQSVKKHYGGLKVSLTFPQTLAPPHLPSISACLTGSMRETISARSVKEAFGQVTI